MTTDYTILGITEKNWELVEYRLDVQSARSEEPCGQKSTNYLF